ncbi:copper resistance system multicopper oxidase, partial [Luteimonas sp. SDU101]|uniref:copper resistance system multicopper oxidase n=1 Tax=Luteimonas sp. SDU101 TaxID=3422593 RepID=UPI003EBE1871
MIHPPLPRPPSPARRRFVQGLLLGGATLAAGTLRNPALAGSRTYATPGQTLSGDVFQLDIGASLVNFTGRVRPAITVNDSLPAPLLRWREGDTVTLRVSNRLPQGHPSSIHWHGILLPSNMDGVPGMSFDGIMPGESYLYRFTLRQSGTYWYHSHSVHQEQAGLYGAIVVDAREPAPYHWDREHVVLLSDWTDLAPSDLFARLKKAPHYDNWYKPTIGDFLRDARRDGLAAALADRRAWGEMRMTPSDLSDVNAHTYTYLMNGATPSGNWTGEFRPGEKLLLRLINASAMTHFDLRIPGLKMTVVAADGQYVHPVSVDELRMGAAETYDVIVEPRGQEAYTIFAQDMGRTGHARGTLAVRAGLQAPVPSLDPRPRLTMDDMGHGGGHGAMTEGGCGAAMAAEGGCGARHAP